MEVFRGIAGRVVVASSIDVYRACGVLHGSEEGPLEPVPLPGRFSPRQHASGFARRVDSRRAPAHLGEHAHEVETNEAGPANNENPHTTRLLQPEVTQAWRGCASPRPEGKEKPAAAGAGRAGSAGGEFATVVPTGASDTTC
jgi:hypothetical protein